MSFMLNYPPLIDGFTACTLSNQFEITFPKWRSFNVDRFHQIERKLLSNMIFQKFSLTEHFICSANDGVSTSVNKFFMHTRNLKDGAQENL
jgi:hypothetical protein